MRGYSALLSLGLLLSAPWWGLRMATTRRYREGLRERLGVVPARLRAAAAGKRVVWVHAVSVGEVLAVSRLVAELEASLNKTTAAAERASWTVVISTTTRTGQALARERFGAERVFYFPLDFAFAVRAFLRGLRPAMLILAESELWPRTLHECVLAGVPAAVVNARVSDRSFRRALRVRNVWGQLLRKVTLWLAQSEEDARRLVAMGALRARVQTSGNLKYDVIAPTETAVTRSLRAALGGAKLVVAGSTLADEEATLLRIWPTLRLSAPDAVLLIAPRHPERFAAVATLLRDAELPFLRCSELDATTDRIAAGEILLLDTIGDLAAVYGLACAAFVGGSLVDRGGHNPLEAARFGVPVVMGQHFENFRGAVGAMQENDAIRIVSGGEALRACFEDWLTHGTEAKRIGERGREIFERQGGATARTVDALLSLLSTVPAARTHEAVPV